MNSKNKSGQKNLAALQKKLQAQGVKYCLGAYVDILGLQFNNDWLRA